MTTNQMLALVICAFAGTIGAVLVGALDPATAVEWVETVYVDFLEGENQ